jgi:hypothetical protein
MMANSKQSDFSGHGVGRGQRIRKVWSVTGTGRGDVIGIDVGLKVLSESERGGCHSGTAGVVGLGIQIA